MRTLISVVAVSLLAGCGGGERHRDAETVVAGFYPLAWAAERIAGPGVEVVNLTPAGAEPHDIELSPRDVEKLRAADLVLYLGRGFQPALEKAADNRTGPSLDLLEGQRLLSGVEEKQASDPHVWLDPSRFAAMVTTMGAALHRKNAAAGLAVELRTLDTEIAYGLENCRLHEIITSHAAFGYLAARYGLRQIALTGLSPEAEPSPRDIEALVDEVRRSGATTVFFETLVSPKLAETVAREAGAKTAVLDPLEGLTEDDVAAGEDYLSVMRRNLKTLREALRCR